MRRLHDVFPPKMADDINSFCFDFVENNFMCKGNGENIHNVLILNYWKNKERNRLKIKKD